MVVIVHEIVLPVNVNVFARRRVSFKRECIVVYLYHS